MHDYIFKSSAKLLVVEKPLSQYELQDIAESLIEDINVPLLSEQQKPVFVDVYANNGPTQQ